MPKGLDILLTTKKAIILALFSQFHSVGNFRNVLGRKKNLKKRNLNEFTYLHLNKWTTQIYLEAFKILVVPWQRLDRLGVKIKFLKIKVLLHFTIKIS